MSKAPIIGIDLGTTNSCVAVMLDNKVEIIANEHGIRTTPSQVAFDEEERMIGNNAKKNSIKNYHNTVFDVKRFIGRKFTDPVVQDDIKNCHQPFEVVVDPADKPLIKVNQKKEEKTFQMEEISAMVLSQMKETAETRLGRTVTQAVITVPAQFNDSQRQATKDAAEIAGLECLRIINEPTAAAMAQGLDRPDKEKEGPRNVLVFDLGGGTFDVTLLTIDEDTFDVKATSGDTHLGGRDFDTRLVNQCVEQFKQNGGNDVSQNKKAMMRLRTQAEEAKCTLSSLKQTEINIDSLAEGVDFSLKISRAKFEELNYVLFTDTMKPVKIVLDDAKMDKANVHEIVMVGGSSRIPVINDLIKAFFDGKEPCKSINPDEAVALGAAIQATILSENCPESLQEILLVDVLPLSLGIETEASKMNIMLNRNTTIPNSNTKVYSTQYDNQSTVNIKVFEGERKFTKDNNCLGNFRLNDIPPGPRGIPQIEVVFDVDANGILKVTAVEKGTGKTGGITITNDAGHLSKDEIEKMVSDAERFKDEDAAMKRKMEARNKLEHQIYQAKTTVRNDKGMISGKEKAQVNDICEKISNWLEMQQNASQQDQEAKQREVETMFIPIKNKIY